MPKYSTNNEFIEPMDGEMKLPQWTRIEVIKTVGYASHIIGKRGIITEVKYPMYLVRIDGISDEVFALYEQEVKPE